MPRKADAIKQQMKEAAAQTAAASYITGDEKKETKSARTSFLLYPSVYNDFRTLADALRVSPSDLLNTIMRDYVNQHRDLISRELEYRAETAEALKKN